MAGLRVVGLFSGVGGFELGFERAGHHSVHLCEIDEGARGVLERQFPGIETSSDVRRLTALPRNADVVVAGFPCQDLSQAGRSIGIAGSRSRLVREVFRLLKTRRVQWVVLENVPFMLRLDGGAAIRSITRRLEKLEYKWAYRVMDSRAFGIPQRRHRVFIVAALDHDPRLALLSQDCGASEPCFQLDEAAHGFYWTEGNRGLGWAENAIPALKGGSGLFIPSPPAIVLTDGRVVRPTIKACERLQGFPIGWTRPADRLGFGRRRGAYLGNAVTVNAAEWLGSRLAAEGTYDSDRDVPLERRDPWPNAGWFDGLDRGVARASSWPVRRKLRDLESFIGDRHEPLSGRAAAGFLCRLENSTLRVPIGLRDALLAHIESVGAMALLLALRAGRSSKNGPLLNASVSGS